MLVNLKVYRFTITFWSDDEVKENELISAVDEELIRAKVNIRIILCSSTK